MADLIDNVKETLKAADKFSTSLYFYDTNLVQNKYKPLKVTLPKAIDGFYKEPVN